MTCEAVKTMLELVCSSNKTAFGAAFERHTYLVDAVLAHGVQHIEQGAEVVVVVLERLGDRLPHRLHAQKIRRSAGKMELTGERHQHTMLRCSRPRGDVASSIGSTHLQRCEVDDCIEARTSHHAVDHRSVSTVTLQGKTRRMS